MSRTLRKRGLLGLTVMLPLLAACGGGGGGSSAGGTPPPVVTVPPPVEDRIGGTAFGTAYRGSTAAEATDPAAASVPAVDLTKEPSDI